MQTEELTPVCAFVKTEFASLATLVFARPNDVQMTFESDANLKQTLAITAGGGRVHLCGRTNSDVVTALYHFYEHCGMHFGFSERMFCQEKKLEAVPEISLEMTPSVARRGIRMHLNFVQDQSFFTEPEFEGFVDRVAGMKFNYLLFHMYNSQEWFPFVYKGINHLELELGNMAGQPLPNDMIGREKIKTRKIWYPAELEGVEDKAELMAAVYARYRRMMVRAKQRGMAVAASIEPEDISGLFEEKIIEWSNAENVGNKGYNLANDWQQGWSGKKTTELDTLNPLLLDMAVERCVQLYAAYPELDELHLISREGTSFLANNAQEYQRELLRLGQSLGIAFDEQCTHALEQVNQDDVSINHKAYPYWTVLPGENYYATFTGAMRYLEFVLAILRDERMQNLGKKVKLVVSLYSPNPGTIRLVNQYAGKIIPPGIRFDILGDYGARDICDQMKSWNSLLSDKKDVGVISWLEFDGNMDLAQNWTRGIYDNVEKAVGLGLDTVYFNHWRVRALEHNAKMASEACFDVSKGYDSIMNSYADDVFGTTNRKAFGEAAKKLEAATELCKNFLYNVGFTGDWVYRYATDPPGYRWEDLNKAIQLFEQSTACYTELAAGSLPRGQKEAAYHTLLSEISKLHLNMVIHLQKAKLPLVGFGCWPLSEKGNTPPPDLLVPLLANAQQALAYATAYMRALAPFVEACDEQGQLAHYQLGVVQPLQAFVKWLTKEGDE